MYSGYYSKVKGGIFSLLNQSTICLIAIIFFSLSVTSLIIYLFINSFTGWNSLVFFVIELTAGLSCLLFLIIYLFYLVSIRKKFGHEYIWRIYKRNSRWIFKYSLFNIKLKFEDNALVIYRKNETIKEITYDDIIFVEQKEFAFKASEWKNGRKIINKNNGINYDVSNDDYIWVNLYLKNNDVIFSALPYSQLSKLNVNINSQININNNFRANPRHNGVIIKSIFTNKTPSKKSLSTLSKTILITELVFCFVEMVLLMCIRDENTKGIYSVSSLIGAIWLTLLFFVPILLIFVNYLYWLFKRNIAIDHQTFFTKNKNIPVDIELTDMQIIINESTASKYNVSNIIYFEEVSWNTVKTLKCFFMRPWYFEFVLNDGTRICYFIKDEKEAVRIREILNKK